MEKRYNPNILMLHTALNAQHKGELVFFVDDGKDFGNYRIEINLIGQNEKPLKIIKAPDSEDALLHVLQGGRALCANALEAAQDRLGNVNVYYKGKLCHAFKSYNDFLEWMGTEKLGQGPSDPLSGTLL